MPIKLADLKLYGSQVMPDDDTVTAIGGPIDRTKRPAFQDVAGQVQVVSSTTVDTTQQVTVFGRDATSAIVNEAKTLSGTTPVALLTTYERLLKSLKNAITQGDVAVENQTPVLTGNLVGCTLDDVTLPGAASAVDGAYNQYVLRLTGTSKAIRRIINYVGSTRLATVDHAYPAFFPASGDATGSLVGSGESFRISAGYFFDKLPAEIIQVRRIHYNAAADIPGGATRKYYEKLFWENTNPSLTLGVAQVLEASDPSGLLAFGIATLFGGGDTNGGGNNRQVMPVTNVTGFDSLAKNVPGGTGDLRSGSTLAMWTELTLGAGAPSTKTTYTPRLTGTTA